MKPSTRFGKFANSIPSSIFWRNLKFIKFSTSLFVASFACLSGTWAQSSGDSVKADSKGVVLVKSAFQKGKVLTDQATVYQDPDFDSPVLGRMKIGTFVTISKQVFGAFYRVQIGKNRFGYITDVDAQPLTAVKKAEKTLSEAKEEIAEKSVEDKRKMRPFSLMNFRGVEISSLRFRENTMGLRPTDLRNFYGFTASGPNVISTGLYTDFNFMVSPGAPKYYEEATGQSTDGFILLTNFLFQSVNQQSPTSITYFGFGPMFRYSRYGVSFTNSVGDIESYSLEDMAIGAIFNLGLGFKFDQVSVKIEGQYLWERLQYFGVSTSLQFAF